MYELTKDERIEINRRLGIAVGQFREGTDPKQVLAQLYCEFMPDKDEWQGLMMADRLIGAIRGFEEHYECAVEEQDYLRLQLMHFTEKMDDERACRVLDAMAKSWSLMDSGMFATFLGSEESREKFDMIGASLEARPYDGPCDGEARAELLERALKIMSKDNMSEFALDQMQRCLDAGDSPVYASLRGKIQEDTLNAISSMIIYTMAASGQLHDVEAKNVRIEEVTVGVCTQNYIHQIRSDCNRGFVSFEEAARRLEAVRKVFFFLLNVLEFIALMFFYGECIATGNLLAAIIVTFPLAYLAAKLDNYLNAKADAMIAKIAGDFAHKRLSRQIAAETEPMEREDVRETSPKSSIWEDLRAVFGNSGTVDSEDEGITIDPLLRRNDNPLVDRL